MPYERGGPGGGYGGGREQRGVPDGLLVGGLAFLLGVAVLIWSATGLAGFFAHGAWPDGVSFAQTPEAVRALLAEPHDVAAAWPKTPDGQLSGYGLFWGIFIGQLMVLIVLAVFVLGTVTRWRAVRRAARADARSHAGEAGVREGPTPKRPPRRGTGPGEDRPQSSGEAAGPPPQEYGPAPGHQQDGAPHHRHPDGYGHPRDIPGPPGMGAENEPAGAAPDGSVSDGSISDGSISDGSISDGSVLSADVSGSGVPGPRYGPGEAEERQEAPGTPGERTYEGGSAATPPPLGPGHSPGFATGLGREITHGLFIAPHPRTALQAVQDAEGAALVVTADPALYTATVGARSKFGPAHVYDPAQLTDAPTRLRWAPHRACEHMPTARLRAAALLAPVRSPARGESAVHDAAEILLRCWLHAAAVAGEPFRQVHRWALTGSSKEAVRILRTHGGATGGSAGELEGTLTGHPERREAATALVRRALGSLSQLHIRNACTPARADRVAWESFIPEGGTLYVVGEAIEAPHRSDPASMPLLTALASAVVEHGRRIAEGASAGRLDPPLTVVLDHPATVAPLPELPGLLADGEASGLCTVVLLRSEEQGRTWWPEAMRGAHQGGSPG
ncbi:hypothetical protein LHJ74_23945 [Streptomyces sp. N2-109]|uniref:Type VI secretion protein n=1 Tax=Streptomyces gossypii TaxID=2883101 RepID=A0ABT2JYF9_9ACTN|nr:hypothetical protein [Streptomyces gossypii]MCT2592928.1 hypothetical protein [Streptomyces gossypii]